MHEDGLARAQPAALDERELRGQVVHRQRRALVERQLVGQREEDIAGHHDPLGRAAVRHDAGDPLAAGLEPAGPLTHGAGEVDAERERRLRLELVLPLAQQQVGERDPDPVHLHEHVVGAGRRLLDVAHLESRDRWA